MSPTQAMAVPCSDRVCFADAAGSAGSTEGMFAEQVAPLQAAAPASTRFVLVTATLPAHTFEQLQQDFPGITAAIGPNLHRTSLGRGLLSWLIWSCKAVLLRIV